MRRSVCVLATLLVACSAEPEATPSGAPCPTVAPPALWVRAERVVSRRGGLYDRPEDHGQRLVTFRDDDVYWARAPLEPAETLRTRGERLLEEGDLRDALLVLEDARDADDDDEARTRVSLATGLLDRARRERRIPEPVPFETVSELFIEAVAWVGRVIFVHLKERDGRGCLAGIDERGGFRWRVRIETSEHVGLVAGRRIYVAFAQSVLALDLVEGKVLWAHACSGSAHGHRMPRLELREEVLELTASGSVEEAVERYDARTGMLLE